MKSGAEFSICSIVLEIGNRDVQPVNGTDQVMPFSDAELMCEHELQRLPK